MHDKTNKQIGVVCDTSIVEPRCEKTGLRAFRPGPTKTGLCSHRRSLETWNFGIRRKRDCTIRVAKTKALISFTITAKLICVFVFACAKSRFSHNDAHLSRVLVHNLHSGANLHREQFYTRVQICTPLCRVHMPINCVQTHLDFIGNLTQGTHLYKKFAVFECSK